MKLVTLVVSLLVAVGSAWAQLGIDEGFDGALPDFHTYQATYAADTARAHGGAQSLASRRVAEHVPRVRGSH